MIKNYYFYKNYKKLINKIFKKYKKIDFNFINK